MLASTTQLNTPGIALGAMAGVHALTDVTGFGLLGHLLEICRGSGRRARRSTSRALPLHPGRAATSRATASSPARRGATGRATASDVDAWRRRIGDAERALLTDPQTSGGLLVACAPERVDAVLAIFRAEGFDDAAVIGEIAAGAPRIVVS